MVNEESEVDVPWKDTIFPYHKEIFGWIWSYLVSDHMHFIRKAAELVSDITLSITLKDGADGVEWGG